MASAEIDSYLRGVLTANKVAIGLLSPVMGVTTTLNPILRPWGGQQIVSITPSGSFSKGTAVHGGTDIDIFVSLASTLNMTLKDIYDSLFNHLAGAGYRPRRQNVSVGINVGTYKVDVTPARRQDQVGNYHSLYSNRSQSWLQTNVNEHIRTVTRSGRTEEIKLLKIWRNRFGFDWPSFYLELFVIDVLAGKRVGNLSANIEAVISGIRDSIATRRLIDPANTNNRVSDTLATQGKTTLMHAAAKALATPWNEVFI